MWAGHYEHQAAIIAGQVPKSNHLAVNQNFLAPPPPDYSVVSPWKWTKKTFAKSQIRKRIPHDHPKQGVLFKNRAILVDGRRTVEKLLPKAIRCSWNFGWEDESLTPCAYRGPQWTTHRNNMMGPDRIGSFLILYNAVVQFCMSRHHPTLNGSGLQPVQVSSGVNYWIRYSDLPVPKF